MSYIEIIKAIFYIVIIGTPMYYMYSFYKDLLNSKAKRLIFDYLLNRESPKHYNFSKEKYILPPFTLKSDWTLFGTQIKEKENKNSKYIDGSNWITIRFDGKNFGKFIKALRKNNILSPGYSEDFSLIMKECCQKLMNEFNAIYGYTQSDEMTILIPPTSKLSDDTYNCHPYNGKSEKICSITSSYLTSQFNFKLFELCKSKNICYTVLKEHLPVFDSRTCGHKNYSDAISVILWRAYDCGVNGVSDAIHLSNINESLKKNYIRYDTMSKLSVLNIKELLPLPDHQAYGSLYYRSKKKIIGYNPKEKREQESFRYSIEKIEGNILLNFRERKFI